jgi:hypothetical protein
MSPRTRPVSCTPTNCGGVRYCTPPSTARPTRGLGVRSRTPRGPGTRRGACCGTTPRHRSTLFSAHLLRDFSEFPPPHRRSDPVATIGFGKHIEPGHMRPTSATVLHAILRRVSLRGNVQRPVPPSPTRTYDRGRERKSRGPRLTSRHSDTSRTEKFGPLTIPRPGRPCRRRSPRNGRSIRRADMSHWGPPWIKNQAIGRITPRPHHDPARRPTPPAGP